MGGPGGLSVAALSRSHLFGSGVELGVLGSRAKED